MDELQYGVKRMVNDLVVSASICLQVSPLEGRWEFSFDKGDFEFTEADFEVLSASKGEKSRWELFDQLSYQSTCLWEGAVFGIQFALEALKANGVCGGLLVDVISLEKNILDNHEGMAYASAMAIFSRFHPPRECLPRIEKDSGKVLFPGSDLEFPLGRISLREVPKYFRGESYSEDELAEIIEYTKKKNDEYHRQLPN